ncbi:MAG: AlpA family phage regulatory protein [Nitrosomonas sp.]|uniref:helix-turn-helix transcriptional regulator n=1 Tax=Nitrosomonas sp. TaxID=42353 RepID=UPI0032EEAFC7
MRRVLRTQQVIQMSGMSRSAIYRLRKENKFVRHINLGPRSVGYFEDELTKWLEERVEVSRKT